MPLRNVISQLRFRFLGPKAAAESMVAVDTFIAEHHEEAVAACEAEKASSAPTRARFLTLVCAELARQHQRGVIAARKLLVRRGDRLEFPSNDR